MNARSPFRPSFGVSPPEIAGRDATIDALVDGLDEGPAASTRVSLVTGARGIGKTIVLNAIEDAARQRGWLVISETLTPGLLARLDTEHVPQAWAGVRAELPPDPTHPRSRRRLSGVSIPGGLGGVSFAVTDAAPLPGLRTNLAALATGLGERGSGLLLTVDELHRGGGAVHDDLQTLAGIVQHLWREQAPIAFVGAGLPAAIQDLLNDRVITFLRRAERFTLDLLDDDAVADALRGPIEAAGRRIDDDALERATQLAAGYPYLVQIVGDLSWRVASDRETITRADVAAIAARAIRTLGAQVHQPAVAALSERDLDFLTAMLPDAGPTALADLLTRLDVDNSYASRYRARLIARGLVRPAGRGRLTFALPYLREHLATLER